MKRNKRRKTKRVKRRRKRRIRRKRNTGVMKVRKKRSLLSIREDLVRGREVEVEVGEVMSPMKTNHPKKF